MGTRYAFADSAPSNPIALITVLDKYETESTTSEECSIFRELFEEFDRRRPEGI